MDTVYEVRRGRFNISRSPRNRLDMERCIDGVCAQAKELVGCHLDLPHRLARFCDPDAGAFWGLDDLDTRARAGHLFSILSRRSLIARICSSNRMDRSRTSVCRAICASTRDRRLSNLV